MDRSVSVHYRQVQVTENGNLRFAEANDVGIRASRGKYDLILNPDAVIHEGALDKIVTFATSVPKLARLGAGC